MVLSAFLASLPTVGYTDDLAGSLKRSKFQQYFAEALAADGEGRSSKDSSHLQGHSFGSPLPMPQPAAAGAQLGPSDFLQLLPAAGLRQPASQHCRQRQRAASSDSRESRESQGNTCSPAAVASPRAMSDGTVSPDSCSLRQAVAAAPPSLAATQRGSGAPSSPSASYRASYSSVASLTPTSSFSEGQLERLGSAEPAIDLRFVIQQLRAPRQTGQVCSWGWDQAARLSHTRRSMPAELFAALWGATEASAGRCYPQDVLCIVESWLTLMQTCPRHFRLHAKVVDTLITYSIPAAVKRMNERQLAQLAGLCCDVALHRSETGAMTSSGQGPSARDLMQPVFGLVVAETAWRCSNELRYVSVQTLHAVERASSTWRWKVVRHRDSPQLAALKEATREALQLLQGHMPE